MYVYIIASVYQFIYEYRPGPEPQGTAWPRTASQPGPEPQGPCHSAWTLLPGNRRPVHMCIYIYIYTYIYIYVDQSSISGFQFPDSGFKFPVSVFWLPVSRLRVLVLKRY